MEAKVARWREVEAGTRFTAKTAMERFPQLKKQLYTNSFGDLPSEIARKPKFGNRGACDVKTYLASDVDDLVARLAAPDSEPVDPRWLEVEAGTRNTQTTAMERYPQLNSTSFKDLRSEIARKPKIGDGRGGDRARDVKTYLATDVDDLVARLAAPDSEPEPVDPRWREVEAGTRNTIKTAMERYPQLPKRSFENLPSEIARMPKDGNGRAYDVKTYLAADVDALVARLAAPDPVDPRWREVEAGTRYTQTLAIKKYPQLNPKSFKDLPNEIARKPRIGNARPSDVKTYAAAAVDALVARLAAPDQEPVDPRWLEVEAGTRSTQTLAIKKYPQLNTTSFKDLPSEIARQPKSGSGRGGNRACDVKTYLAADIDALVARLAAPEPEPVDPRWREVEAGTRNTIKTAMERYPQLNTHSFEGLPSKIAVKPKTGNIGARGVKTYLAADIDALVARLAAPEPVDPRWREVEAGARYDQRTAMKRYPKLYSNLFLDLPFEIARRPKIGSRAACDVKTYAAADVDKLAASRAKKRARVQEPEPPQEPEPEPEEEPEECPVCLDPMTGATATLVCGHLFCKDCIADWARSQTTCPTCRATLEVA